MQARRYCQCMQLFCILSDTQHAVQFDRPVRSGTLICKSGSARNFAHPLCLDVGMGSRHRAQHYGVEAPRCQRKRRTLTARLGHGIAFIQSWRDMPQFRRRFEIADWRFQCVLQLLGRTESLHALCARSRCGKMSCVFACWWT